MLYGDRVLGSSHGGCIVYFLTSENKLTTWQKLIGYVHDVNRIESRESPLLNGRQYGGLLDRANIDALYQEFPYQNTMQNKQKLSKSSRI